MGVKKTRDRQVCVKTGCSLFAAIPHATVDIDTFGKVSGYLDFSLFDADKNDSSSVISQSYGAFVRHNRYRTSQTGDSRKSKEIHRALWLGIVP